MSRENRDVRIGLRLLPAERQALEELADLRGERYSETVRALLSEAIKSAKRRSRQGGGRAGATCQ